MLLIDCPYCGPRDEIEFHCGGEGHIARPSEPDKRSDAEWADYLYMRKNSKGLFLERWHHSHGCRRWFNLARDTYSHEILAVYKMGDPPPRGLGETPEPARKRPAAGGRKKPAAKGGKP